MYRWRLLQTGMTKEKDVVPAGDKCNIKLKFATKDARNAFRDDFFPAGANSKRATTLKFKDDSVWFSCLQPEWQTELFEPLWELKEGYEARGSTSVKPPKLSIDYQKEWLVDATDSKLVYAKIVNGGVDVTAHGKGC